VVARSSGVHQLFQVSSIPDGGANGVGDSGNFSGSAGAKLTVRVDSLPSGSNRPDSNGVRRGSGSDE
jgi:hypothetical protein